MQLRVNGNRKEWRRSLVAAVAVSLLLSAPIPCLAAASTTTTTTLTGVTTTTMFIPVDVTGGGQFEGGFPKGSFDAFSFTLEDPRVLVAEVSNGFGGCPGDSILELRRPGAPGDCNGEYGDDLPCVAVDDDSGIAVCSKLVHRVAAPGEYEIRVSAYGGKQLSRYFLDVEFLDVQCGDGRVDPTEECDDGNAAGGDCCSATCTRDTAGTPCSDSVFCNGPDTCSAAGLCTEHAGDPCAGPDGDGDCTETCDEGQGACAGPDPDATDCDDGLFCNGADSCAGGECGVHAGDPCAGPDGDGDCAESCSEEADDCTAADPGGSPCDDGTFCNGADSCLDGACSVNAGDPCAGADGDLDCSETCDEAAGACTGADADGSACEDGLFCNGADSCAGGLCNGHAGSTCPGADGDGDCAESCSDVEEGCTGADPAGAPCDDGNFCNGPDRCSGGSCSIHEGDPCPGADGDADCSESCDEAAGDCTAPDPEASPCDDESFCNGADTCDAGECSTHDGNPCPGADGDADCSEGCDEAADACSGTDANGTPCDDGLYCNGTDTCAAGSCSQHAGDPCPGSDGDTDCSESCSEAADACTAADVSGTPCDDGVFCNGADSCAAGACQHTGDPCQGPDGDIDCSETCDEAQGACTAADPGGSPCDDALFCNGADTCASGACTAHTGNPCPGPDGDGNCAESCNETAENCTAADLDGRACTDGLFCNGADACAAGACSQHAGTPCPGADGDADCTETCDEAVDNCTAADPDASPCTDGVFCNGPDRCSAGACGLHLGNPCTGADGDGNCSESCNEVADACTAPDANGAPCTDGVFCNGADACSAGACSTHAGNPCPGVDGDGNCVESCSEVADACTAADANGSPCNDGLFCNGADTCSAGACSAHAGDPCPGADGDGNCAESCDEPTDSCAAADPPQSPCNDLLFCNGADTCSAGACSVHAGNPCGLPDGDGNCAESCSEGSDTCTAADPIGSACNDGVFCNGADSCLAGACSQHAGNPCAGADGDLDCSETCDDAADACTGNDPDGSACEDGLFCNGADSCVGGLCNQHTGSACPGADGDGDCSESCSDTQAGCTGADPAGASCDDGNFCNGADHCSGGSCSLHDGDPCPGADGDGDCTESCDEAVDSCTAPDPLAAACNDGVFCNGADSCATGACSQHAGDPCPGADGDGDCTETCDESVDACVAPDPNASACDDGQFCNGADSCTAGACSVHAGDPCPGPDGDGDCAESCSEASDTCAAPDANGSACSDGFFCNGADNCAAGACSQHAGAPCPGADGDGDCSESCDEQADACTGDDPDGSPCDDSLFCDGEDACADGICAAGASSPCADDDECTTDTCNEAADACANDPIVPCTTTTTLPVTTTTLPLPTCGDATGDGLVKSTDALFVLRTAVGDDQCGAQRCACDPNGSGTVTASDALLVLKKAVGQAVVLACGC